MDAGQSKVDKREHKICREREKEREGEKRRRKGEGKERERRKKGGNQTRIKRWEASLRVAQG